MGQVTLFVLITPMQLHGGPNIYEVENFLTGPLQKFCLAISMCLILLTNLSFLQPWTTLFQTVKRLFPWYLVPSLYSLVYSPQSLVPGTQSLVPSPWYLVPGPYTLVPSSLYLVPGPQSQVPGTQSLVPIPQSIVHSPQSLVLSSVEIVLTTAVHLISKQKCDEGFLSLFVPMCPELKR